MGVKLAGAGWVVEVSLAGESRNERVLFAVGEDTATAAEKAVLRYPGIYQSDPRIAQRPLSPVEISRLQLMPGGVRPFERLSE